MAVRRFEQPELAGVRTLLCLILIAMTGCAAPPIEDSRGFSAPFEDTWDAAEAVLESRSLIIDVRAKERGLFETRKRQFSNRERVMRKYMSLPRLFSMGAFWTRARVKLRLTVRAISQERSEVQVHARLEAFEMNTTREWHACDSLGRMEREILDDIQSTLDLPPPTGDAP